MTAAEARLAAALALGSLVVVLDTTILIVATPALSVVFGAHLTAVQWATTAYLLALVAAMPMAPWLGSRFAPATVYGAALAGFALASLAAAAAPELSVLIAARVLQGLSGGLAVPLAMSIGLGDVPAERRGRVAAVLGLPVLIGPLLGPLLAGWLIDAISWRAIFLVVVPPALAAAWAVPRLAPAVTLAPRRFDVVGAGLAIPGLTLTVIALAGETFGGTVRLGALGVGIALMVAFVRHAARHDEPLVDVGLLRHRAVGGAAGVLALFSAAYFGSALLLPGYVQFTRGDSATTAALVGIPMAVATGVSLQVCTRLVDRVDPGRVIGGGLALAAAGFVALAVMLRADTPYAVLALATAVIGAGCGGVLMPAQVAAVRGLHGNDLGSVTAMLPVLSQVANAAGTAAITVAYAMLARTRTDLDDPAQAAGLSRSAREAVASGLVDAQRLVYVGVGMLVVVAALVARRTWPATDERRCVAQTCEQGSKP